MKPFLRLTRVSVTQRRRFDGSITRICCALSRSILFAATGILVHGRPGLQHQHRRRKQQHRPPLSVLRRKVPLYVLKLYTELRAAAVSLLVSGILKKSHLCPPPRSRDVAGRRQLACERDSARDADSSPRPRWRSWSTRARQVASAART